MTAPVARPGVRPSGWWYLAAAGLLLVGLVAAGVTLSRAWGAARDAGFDASLAPPGQEQPLTIEEPGSYTIAYAGPIVVDSVPEQEQLAEDVAVSITPADGGAPLVLEPYEGLNDFEQDGDQYVPLQTVRFDQAGEYTFRSSPSAMLDPARSVLLVTESPWRKLRDGATRAVALVVVGTFLAILSTVILATTRGRAKRARRVAGPTGPWPPRGGPAPGPGYGYGPPPGGPPGWPPAR